MDRHIRFSKRLTQPPPLWTRNSVDLNTVLETSERRRWAEAASNWHAIRDSAERHWSSDWSVVRSSCCACVKDRLLTQGKVKHLPEEVVNFITVAE